MDPNDGLFSAAKEREEQARVQAEAAAANPPAFNPSAGLFSAAAERALGGLPEAKKVEEVIGTRAQQDAERAKRLSQRRLPLPVIFIAIYKILVAVLIIVPLTIFMLLPASAFNGNSVITPAIFLRLQSHAMQMLAVPAIFAVYNLVVAVGLLTKQKWARRIVMGGAFVALLYGVRSLWIASVMSGTMFFPGSDFLLVGMLFELIIFLTMKMYPDVREVFNVGAYEK
jgi:hypothetical protein